MRKKDCRVFNAKPLSLYASDEDDMFREQIHLDIQFDIQQYSPLCACRIKGYIVTLRETTLASFLKN
ncbi:MAG: hypothetical protein BGN96_13055 [Bacteroidales bacterium 45-6]|nr:MAG: hypothetical protein BGN96_13055 [Bacteroidales bacterium 45-6]